MRSHAIRYLILPGWQGSPADHWQSHWQHSLPAASRVEQLDWDNPDPREWVASLDRRLAEASTPTILIAHSLGCITVARWAAQASGHALQRVRGALLVAPADVERPGCPQELRSLLALSARSIGDYIDGSMEILAEFLRSEREARLRDSHVERRELVTRIVEGGEVNVHQASRQLGYTLEQAHHAAVIWSEEADTQLATLESAAAALMRCTGSRQSLTVLANTATLWVWIAAEQPVDQAALQASIKNLPGVRLAIGSAGQGIEGFRRAHLDALTTQRVLGRLQSRTRVVSFDRIRLVSLMTRDPKANQRFVAHTLGQLTSASPQLRRTLLTFLACGSNATLAAQRLHTLATSSASGLAIAPRMAVSRLPGRMAEPIESHRPMRCASRVSRRRSVAKKSWSQGACATSFR